MKLLRRSWQQGLLRWRRLPSPTRLLPSQCAVCHGWGEARVCAVCLGRYARLKPRCQRCAALTSADVELCGQCVLSPPAFDAACAALDYAFPWNDLLLRLKFHEGLDLLTVLTERMLHAHAALQPPMPPGLLLPVPLSIERLKERGYNQAWELARRLASSLTCETDPTLLLRIKDTPHQLSLPRAQRASAVRGAFALDPLRRTTIAGRTVTVVDDVMTTMATANEIAGVLRAAGAARVQLWCVARTPATSPPT